MPALQLRGYRLSIVNAHSNKKGSNDSKVKFERGKQMVDAIKFIFKLQFLRQPFWFIVIAVVVMFIFNQLELEGYYFVTYSSNEEFKKYYIDFTGLLNLLILLRKNGQLAFYFDSLELVSLLLATGFLFCIFYFRTHVQEIFVPGKIKKTYITISAFMFTQLRLLPYLLGIFIMWQFYGYINAFRSAYQERGNDYLYSEFINISNIKLQQNIESTALNKENVCSFYYPERKQSLIQIPLVDFGLFLLKLDSSKLNERLAEINRVEPRSEVVFSKEFSEEVLAIPEKDSFTRKEVLELIAISKKEIPRRLVMENDIKSVKSPAFILRDDRQLAKLYYRGNDKSDLIYLGRVNYLCSSSSEAHYNQKIESVFGRMP
jgi:hypothetical protein